MLSCVFNLDLALIPTVTEPPRKSRGLSPRIISGDSRRSENTQTQHISIQYHDIQVIKSLLCIKCHVLEFIKNEAQNMLQKRDQSFAEPFISHGKHTLFTLEESRLPQMTYTCES
jgi:hypothetical protein